MIIRNDRGDIEFTQLLDGSIEVTTFTEGFDENTSNDFDLSNEDIDKLITFLENAKTNITNTKD